MKKVSFNPKSRIEGEFQGIDANKDLKEFWDDVKLVLDRLRDRINSIGNSVDELRGRDTFLTDEQIEKLNNTLTSDDLTSELVANLILNYNNPTEIAEYFAEFISFETTLTKEQVRDLYESNDDVNRFTDRLKAKLERLRDLSPAEIKILYEINEDTNAFTDFYKNKLDNLESEKQAVFDFLTPLGMWQVDHNFGYRPAIQVFDENWEEIVAAVMHTSNNQALVYHNINQTGHVIAT